jgi:hypothetical protein
VSIPYQLDHNPGNAYLSGIILPSSPLWTSLGELLQRWTITQKVTNKKLDKNVQKRE